MSAFAFIHGAGDVGWSWHLVAARLARHGHEIVAPDLPDDAASLEECAGRNWAINRTDCRRTFVWSIHRSLVAAKIQTDNLVLLAGMVPRPRESADDRWTNTGYKAAVEEQSARDGGLTGHDDPFVCFYHDVPPELTEEANRKARTQFLPTTELWPLKKWPDVITKFVLCREDRFFPAEFLRRVVRDSANEPARIFLTPDRLA